MPDFNTEPLGPHPVGSFEVCPWFSSTILDLTDQFWQVWVPKEWMAEALSFLMYNRGELTVLVGM